MVGWSLYELVQTGFRTSPFGTRLETRYIVQGKEINSRHFYGKINLLKER